MKAKSAKKDMGKKRRISGLVRQRGQVTIPEEIRRQVAWCQPGMPVLFTLGDNVIIISPFDGSSDLDF